MRDGMTGTAALLLTVLALPALLARAVGGRAPGPGPKLAALAPVATIPAVAAAALATTVTWWLTLLLAIPAVTAVAWQLPPVNRIGSRAVTGSGPGSANPATFTLRVLTVNVQYGSADAAGLVHELRRSGAGVLAIQELTPEMACSLADAGVAQLLPFCHLDPRPGFPGVGIWSRWPLTPLPPVPGLHAAAPRARVDPGGTGTVTLTAVHPAAPLKGRNRDWQRELELVRSALTSTEGPQVVVGDFNASRDHRPFRDLLTAGFVDCADAARSPSWPGFTWPEGRGMPAIMRLDHVLVTRGWAQVRETRIVRVPRTDHRGVLAVIDISLPG
jgi:endonuclease/exonuclease/phosphatase (EEP) superfamily protein YafD